MEKLMESVSRIDVMKSYASVCYEDNVGNIMQISGENWSDDNSKQLNYILENAVGQDYMGSAKITVPEDVTVFPSGYYACVFNEELYLCEYSIKIEYETENGIEVTYLYYLGQYK